MAPQTMKTGLKLIGNALLHLPLYLTRMFFFFLLSESSGGHGHEHTEEKVKLLQTNTYIIIVHLFYVMKGFWKTHCFSALTNGNWRR